jgi:hypothetical protein
MKSDPNIHVASGRVVFVNQYLLGRLHQQSQSTGGLRRNMHGAPPTTANNHDVHAQRRPHDVHAGDHKGDHIPHRIITECMFINIHTFSYHEFD